MPNFRAGVQYDDWRGTAAADSTHAAGVSEMLKSKGLITESEFIVGLEVGVGENHGGPSSPPHLSVFLVDGSGYDGVAKKIEASEGPLNVRRVALDLSFEELFGLFKRFNFVITRKGLKLDGREYIEDYGLG